MKRYHNGLRKFHAIIDYETIVSDEVVVFAHDENEAIEKIINDVEVDYIETHIEQPNEITDIRIIR